MTVRELIKQLQQFDGDWDVEIGPEKLGAFSSGINRVSRAVIEDEGTYEAPGNYKTANDHVIVCIWAEV